MNAKLPQATPFAGCDAGIQATASSYRSRPGFLGLYSASALAVVLGLVYLDIPTFIYRQHDSLPAKYFYYAMFAAVTPLLALRLRSLVAYSMSPFSLWALGVIALNLAHFLVALADGDQSRGDLIGTRIQYAVLAVLLGFAFSTTRTASYERIFPLLATMIPALVIWDFFNPGVLYPADAEGAVLGRAGATFVNPNKAGEAILLTFLLAIPLLRPWARALLLLLVGVGVVLTFARAAILGWMLLWLFLLLRKAVPKYTLAVPLVAFATLPLLLGSFESYVSGREDLAAGLDNILERLDFFQDRVLDDYSARERAQALEAGLDLFLENPIFGAGAGTTHLWSLRGSTHNQPVILAAEYGIFGIALWVWLAVILWKGKHFQDKALQLTATAGFVFLSMFTHNIFDDLYWLMTFALIAQPRRP